MALLRCLPLLVALHALMGAPPTPDTETVFKKRHAHSRHSSDPYHYARESPFDPEVKPFEGSVEESSQRGVKKDLFSDGVHEMWHPDDVPDDGAEEASSMNEDELLPPCLPAATCSSDIAYNKLLRILQVKEQILRQTGLKAPPNMTGVVISKNPALQRIISDLENQESRSKPFSSASEDDFGDDPNIKMEKVFLTAVKAPAWVKIPEGHKLHYFNLSREHSSSIVMANIHMWLKPLSDSRSQDKVAKIVILKVEPSKFPNDYNRLRSVNNDVNVEYSPQGIWAKVDASYMVRQWLMNEEDNLGFVVKVSTMDGRVVEVDTADDDPIHAPLLEMDLREERNDRPKRFANNRICSDRKIERLCCRYPLIIDFLKYKFDFIVAPKKYVANYCRGECPLLYAHKVPHSTVLQQMFPNTTTSIHGPCCGARELAPLKILYFDGEKLKIDTINDMVVKQCSCT